MSDIEEFDPFQVFEVEQRPPMLLHVTVLRARNVTFGWLSDFFDTPDPYVVLKVPNAPERRKRTCHVDNDINPEWNETFIFYLDSKNSNILHITLMNANYVRDQSLGEKSMNINELTMGQKEKKTLSFNKITEVDIEVMVEFDKNPTLRYSLCLCDEEKTFRRMRRQHVMQAMKKLLGEKGPKRLCEVPTVGVIGSGGGFRAMTAMGGVCKALWETQLIDTCMYLGGLSGSSWYISQLYSHPSFAKENICCLNQELKTNIDSSLFWLLKPQSVYRYLDRILQKRQQGQPVSFTDFFGHLVGETLLKGRLNSRLTEQRYRVDEGHVPMPLYTCVHVKKDVSAKVFQEWVEFTPYEIGMPKYAAFMKSGLFGSKFFLGKLCRQFEEPPLHFLQGIWGSAFCILFRRLLDNNKKLDPVEMARLEMAKELDSDNEDNVSSDSSDSELDEERDEAQGFKIPAPPRKRRKINPNRPTLQRQESKQRTKQKGFWQIFLNGMFSDSSAGLLNSRAGRAGVIHNPLRGLNMNRTYPISPFTPMPPVTSTDEFDGIFELHDTSHKKLYMVDAGLTFNSPYPLMLRPQRDVDIILSFDFSARPSDSSPPFKELLLAEKWAKMNTVSFPPIDPKVFDREGMKELYIFRHPTDPHCPIVLHFVLVNVEFRKFSKPGIQRTTQEEMDFADFDIFDDPTGPYSTFNFKYTHEAFERLSQLTEFNTKLYIEDIKNVIAEKIVTKSTLGKRLPIQPKKVKLLQIKTHFNRERLRTYLRSMKQKNSIVSPGIPEECDTQSAAAESSDSTSDSFSDNEGILAESTTSLTKLGEVFSDSDN